MAYAGTRSGSFAGIGADRDTEEREAFSDAHEAVSGSAGVVGMVSEGMNKAEAYWGGQNVGTTDRIASALAGAALAYVASQTSGVQRTALAGAGGYLILRGATGHCVVNHALRTGTNRPSADGAAVIPHGQGIKVEKSVQIMKPASELYAFWRQLDNLPKFMTHLESVEILDGDKSHWVAKAPFGRTVSWDAEVIADTPNQKIAWRSLESADVPNAGSVTFEDKGDRGTRVKVLLEYNPSAGILGAAIAKIWGEEPNQQVYSDLLRFRALMEAGEIPTITGQPIGAGKGRIKE